MAKKRRRPHGNRPPGGSGATRASTATQDRARSKKAEHKELARQRRERELKRMRRSRFIRTYLILVGVSAVAVLAFSLIRGTGGNASGPLPGLLTDRGPWPANTAQVGARLDRLGLPAAGGVFHIHADVQVFVAGNPQTVPANIGLASGVESPLHTHDDTGVIHIESASRHDFTLGDLFDVWGVRLTATCMGGYCDAGDRQLRAYVDGDPVTGSPRAVALADHEVVVLTFGAKSEEPSPIPATYDWSSVAP